MKLAIELTTLIINNVALTHHVFLDRKLTKSLIFSHLIDPTSIKRYPRIVGNFAKTAIVVNFINIGDVCFEKSPIAIAPRTNPRNLPVNKGRPARISASCGYLIFPQTSIAQPFKMSSQSYPKSGYGSAVSLQLIRVGKRHCPVLLLEQFTSIIRH